MTRKRAWFSDGGPALGWRSAVFFGCMSAVVSVVGCGGGDRPRTVPIHGVVTLDHGTWPAEGHLHFLPVEPAAGYPRRAASARFGTDGRFGPPTSWEEADGIVPGKYQVGVECWKVRPTAGGPPPVSYVAPAYQSGARSGIVVEITPEAGDTPFEWNIPVNSDVSRSPS